MIPIVLSLGCSSMMTSTSQYNGTAAMLEQHNYQAAIKQVERSKGKQYKKKDRVLYYLDMGMLYHYAQEYEKSNEMLTLAENSMEDLYTKSVSKAALSMLLNDNALEYSGEDYEDIYTNVFKTLNYLELNQFDDAFVEIKRINMKLDLLEDKYGKIAKELNKSTSRKVTISPGDNRFFNDVLGRYLSMLIYEAEGKFDDARIDQEKIQEAFVLQKHIYNFANPIPSDSLKTEDGKVRVNFLSFIGRAPVKKEYDMFLTTGEDMVMFTGNKPDFFMAPVLMPVGEGYHFRFSVPYIAPIPSQIKSVRVVVDDGDSYELDKIESIDQIATETFKVKEPIIYLKSLTRTIVKGIAAEKQKKRMREKNPGLGGMLMSLATDVAVDLTENADLRISHFFPSTAVIGEVSLPAGNHFFKINYYNASGLIIYSENIGVRNIQPNQLNLVETDYLR